MRAHYRAPIQSLAGDVQPGATVSVFQNGSTNNGTQLGTLITQPVYPDGVSAAPMTNPFISAAGIAEFWLPYPLRVDVGVQVPGQAQVFFADVDVICATLAPTVVAGVNNYALSLSDQLILASATGGNLTLQLPTALANANLQYHFKRTDTSGNAVSVAAQAGQFIDGAATYALASLARVRLFCDGTGWQVI